MNQPVLTDLFVVEVEQLPSVAKECQREGREQAEGTKVLLWMAMREIYLERWAQYGGWTDEEMASKLSVRFGRKIERSTVNARRNEMNGIIERGKRKNPNSGVSNTVWGV